MDTREHQSSIFIKTTAEKCFTALITPSQIRKWWSASHAIVIQKLGGTWVAVWGEDEDKPDYITAASLSAFEPPRRLVMSDFNYFSKDDELPFDSTILQTEFRIENADGGINLLVRQSGFPLDSAADDFYKGCGVGWERTLAAIKEFLEK